MAKRKNTSDKLNWTTPMEDKLIEALVFHSRAGHKVNGQYTSFAYVEIINQLKESFPVIPFDKEKIKNKIKFIKSKFTPCYDIFKKYTSGFAWNSIIGLWEAEETVWEALIELKNGGANLYHTMMTGLKFGELTAPPGMKLKQPRKEIELIQIQLMKSIT